jgi:GrpB-like predicted nucleotidyltransferase (UPF0157 family)
MFNKYQPKDIIYAPYDNNAPAVATEAIRLILGAIKGYKIHHFGSTAIPNMPGKNIINLFISCPITEFESTLIKLDELGFSNHPYRQEPSNRPLKVAEIKFNGKPYGIHVHLLEFGSQNEKNALFFRDYLILHPDVAKEYANLKEKALIENNNDPEIYRQEKNAFIRSILEIAH